jgi:type II secretory pathway pseudopilin PulG
MVTQSVRQKSTISPQARIHSFNASRGFTYVGLLFAVVLLGILMSIAGVVWDTEARREKELQLLFVGQQYQQAIASYHSLLINDQNQFPKSIDELLEDHRFPMPVRHLRKRFVDPITNSAEWSLVLEGDRIVAVHSTSKEAPLKRNNFPDEHADFAGAKTYSEWLFVGR